MKCACGNPVKPPKRKHCSLKCATKYSVRRFKRRHGKAECTARQKVSSAKYLASHRGRATTKAWRASPAGKGMVLRYNQSDHGKAVNAASVARRRTAVDGRVCVGCGRTDSETNWSRNLKYCQACDRRRYPRNTKEAS